MKNFPLAMQAPKSKVSVINEKLLDEAIKQSRLSPRKRIILPFHKSGSDTLHRMINAVQPYSYIRPHHHLTQNKSEAIMLLKGSICVIIFDINGQITDYHQLKANSYNFGIDIEPSVYHMFYAIEPDTVVFEVKPGPYNKTDDKGFALWSPGENSREAESYLKKLIEQTGIKPISKF